MAELDNLDSDADDIQITGQMETIREDQCRPVTLGPNQVVNIGKDLPKEVAEEMEKIEYQDVFACSHHNLTGVSPHLGEHSIPTKKEVRTFCQPMCRMNPKNSLLVKIEIDKLVDVGFIYPVLHYKWYLLLLSYQRSQGQMGSSMMQL